MKNMLMLMVFSVVLVFPAFADVGAHENYLMAIAQNSVSAPIPSQIPKNKAGETITWTSDRIFSSYSTSNGKMPFVKANSLSENGRKSVFTKVTLRDKIISYEMKKKHGMPGNMYKTDSLVFLADIPDEYSWERNKTYVVGGYVWPGREKFDIPSIRVHEMFEVTGKENTPVVTGKERMTLFPAGSKVIGKGIPARKMTEHEVEYWLGEKYAGVYTTTKGIILAFKTNDPIGGDLNGKKISFPGMLRAEKVGFEVKYFVIIE